MGRSGKSGRSYEKVGKIVKDAPRSTLIDGMRNETVDTKTGEELNFSMFLKWQKLYRQSLRHNIDDEKKERNCPHPLPIFELLHVPTLKNHRISGFATNRIRFTSFATGYPRLRSGQDEQVSHQNKKICSCSECGVSCLSCGER